MKRLQRKAEQELRATELSVDGVSLYIDGVLVYTFKDG